MFYTTERLAFLAQLVKDNIMHWGFSKNARVALLTFSENATFIVQDKGYKRVFRVYRPHYHSNREILSELHFMEKIQHDGTIMLPHVYKNQAGDYFLTVTANELQWRIACFSFIDGYEPQISDNLPQWFAKLGELAAQLHKITQHWPQADSARQSLFIRKTWNYETMIGKNAYWGNWRNAGLDQAGKDLLEICDEALKNACAIFVANKTKVALLHADLRLANLLIYGDELAIIDFDDCGFSWQGLDFANAISFIEDEPIIEQLQFQWLNGYAKIILPDKTFIDALPHLIMMRRMQLMAWLVSHNETPTATKLIDQFAAKTVKLAKIYLKRHG